MSFSQATILEVYPPSRVNGELQVSWASSSPVGTLYQVYYARRLAWSGTAKIARIPYPTSKGRIEVGTVGSGEGQVDYSGSLPAAPNDRANLTWLGGTYLDPTGNDDVQGFRIYGESTPGGGIDYGTPLGDVPAYPDGLILDGFGLGGFGEGGFGKSASSYSWTSGPLTSGTWHYAVVVYDAAGNEGTPLLGTVVIAVPPKPPAPGDRGVRLTYTYDPITHMATLNWQPSPSLS